MTPTKPQVRKCVRKWRRLLGLTGWTITIGFSPDDKTSYAEAQIQGEYRLARIDFNLAHIDSPRTLQRVVIHELIHLIIEPLAANAKTMAGPHGDVVVYLEETVVTAIERWPLWRRVKGP